MFMSRCFNLIFLLIVTTFSIQARKSQSKDKPNLVIIYTDEQSIRTIGCYREQMEYNQAYMWGKDVAVETPNIDSIAHEGAMFTNFYASSPMCTPSRSSWVTGTQLCIYLLMFSSIDITLKCFYFIRNVPEYRLVHF